MFNQLFLMPVQLLCNNVMMFLYRPYPTITKFSTISSESRVQAFCDNRTLSVIYVQLLVLK